MRSLAVSCRRLFALALAGTLALTCSPQPVARGRSPQAPDVARLHVLMIDGGGTPAQNYQSHLLHVQQFLDLLLRAGVRREHVSIFTADGPDLAPDLAMREVEPEGDFWLLGGTRLEQALRPITYANSVIPGMTLEAATKEGLKRWFRDARKRLRAGDTLLLYVTDHGTKSTEDPGNNRIVLWGKNQGLSVHELSELLAKLDPGVRVVSLMSQCYSGAFAGLMDVHATRGLPSDAVCGYFSSTADRPAYGCYPENRGVANVGHSFHFIQALAETGRLPDAHRQVLVSDRTPDVPLRTSDVYLERLLRRAAEAQGGELTAVVDDLLREAWRDRGAWEPEIRLLDRIGHAFGCFSPRSLAELDEQAKQLPEISDALRSYSKAWKAALGDAAQANLDRFLAARGEWTERVSDQAIHHLDATAASALAAELVPDLAAHTRADAATAVRLDVLRGKSETAGGASYRMEVRLGVVLRMRAILTSIAGRVYIATRATPEERGGYEALRACEDLALPAPSVPVATTAAAEAFPPFEEDVQLAKQVLPAWMGINFREANPKLREERGLKEGAAAVVTVYPDSPAKAAGLEVGDIVLGPPGKPFTERGQIRQWTMLSRIDEPKPLEILRGAERLRVTLAPKPYPVTFPPLPGPPKISSLAPPLKVSPYRGTLPTDLADSTPHLLFFWATWCAPCKASLSEVLAFEREQHTPVVAITDELPDRLDAFFKGFDHPFPATVAVDEYRRAFQAYGVSGTPTFVLVDGGGVVRSYTTGYAADKGLGIEGWWWPEHASAPVSK